MTLLMFRVLVQKLTPRPKHQVWGYLKYDKQGTQWLVGRQKYMQMISTQLTTMISYGQEYNLNKCFRSTHTHTHNMVPCVGAGASWFTLTLHLWPPEGGFVCWLTQKETHSIPKLESSNRQRKSCVILGINEINHLGQQRSQTPSKPFRIRFAVVTIAHKIYFYKEQKVNGKAN